MLRRTLLTCSLTLATALTLITAPAEARQNRRVVIENNSGYDIMAVYASNVDTDEWEEDLLHRSVLSDGESATFNIDDGSGSCLFDMKLVFEDGDVIYRRATNVCKLGVLRIN